MFKAGINERGEVYIEVYGGSRHYCPQHLMDIHMQRVECQRLMCMLAHAEVVLDCPRFAVLDIVWIDSAPGVWVVEDAKAGKYKCVNREVGVKAIWALPHHMTKSNLNLINS